MHACTPCQHQQKESKKETINQLGLLPLLITDQFHSLELRKVAIEDKQRRYICSSLGNQVLYKAFQSSLDQDIIESKLLECSHPRQLTFPSNYSNHSSLQNFFMNDNDNDNDNEGVEVETVYINIKMTS